MARTIYEGKIDGEFSGFASDRLFRMLDGRCWIQAQHRYWYLYAYRPDALIIEEDGRYMLTVLGESVAVHPVEVLEGRIDGEFHGWTGNNTYRLTNGQVWQQAAYKYEYSYAYAPQVTVYPVDRGYMMDVQGHSAIVRRLK